MEEEPFPELNNLNQPQIINKPQTPTQPVNDITQTSKTSKKNEQYNCQECDSKYSYLRSYQSHIYRDHKGKTPAKNTHSKKGLLLRSAS